MPSVSVRAAQTPGGNCLRAFFMKYDSKVQRNTRHGRDHSSKPGI